MLSLAMNRRSAVAPVLSPTLPSSGQAYDYAASRDRVLFTLLALDLMLMAFFVVLNASATFDAKRSSVVARSFQSKAAPAQENAPAPGGEATRANAAAALRAAVADVFAPYLSGDGAVSVSDDRVDVDVPATLAASVDELPALLGGLARIVTDATDRVELVVRLQASPDDAEARETLAAIADGIVVRGVSPSALSVGTIAGSSGAAARLRFTFFLLNPGDTALAHLAAARLAEHP